MPTQPCTRDNGRRALPRAVDRLCDRLRGAGPRRTDRALANRRRLAALAAEQRAINQSKRADAGFTQARAAVDDYLKNVSEDDTLKETPKLGPLRRRLIESAITFYQQFLKDRRDDPSLRKEIAEVTLKLLKLRRELDGKPYIDEGNHALDLYEKLARDFPEDRAVLAGRLQAIYSAHQLSRAAAEGDRLLAEKPDAPEIHRIAASIGRTLSLRFRQDGDYAGAAKASRRAFEITAEKLGKTPQDVEVVARTLRLDLRFRRPVRQDGQSYGTPAVSRIRSQATARIVRRPPGPAQKH